MFKCIGVTNYKQLKPKCKKLYNVDSQLLKKFRNHNCRKKEFNRRPYEANKFTDKFLISKNSEKISAADSLFIGLQIKETTF